MYIGARGSGGFTGAKRGGHAFGGPAAISYAGYANSDVEDGKIKPDAPPAQLYDLEADLKQTKNLYNEYPEVVKELKALLESHGPPKRNPAPKKSALQKATPNAFAAAGAAPKVPATASARSACFDFESGKLEPWKVVEGSFGHIVGSRTKFFRGREEYNKQGEYYLTTLEPTATAERGSDQQTGVVVSPLFIPKGGKMTFRVGGGNGSETYVALCTEDGKEAQQARGVNSQIMQKASWDLAPYAGQRMFIKIVDKATGGWGHITADNFQFDAEVLTQYPAQAEE